MITNIIAQVVVALVTNVVHSDNAEWGLDYGRILPMNPPRYADQMIKPATERYATTEISERTTVSYTFDGKPYEHVIRERMLSSVTRILRLKEQWEDAGVRTNATESQTIWGEVWTNNTILYKTNSFAPSDPSGGG
jgi:hypothetical protein